LLKSEFFTIHLALTIYKRLIVNGLNNYRHNPWKWLGHDYREVLRYKKTPLAPYQWGNRMLIRED